MLLTANINSKSPTLPLLQAISTEHHVMSVPENKDIADIHELMASFADDLAALIAIVYTEREALMPHRDCALNVSNTC